MTTTVRDIIQDAHIESGARSVADALPAEDAAFALRLLNRLIAKYNNENLMIYTVNRQVFSFVASKQMYTIGTGGDFNVPRPSRIEMASVLINNGSLPTEIPIDILTDEERRETAVFGTPGRFPTAMWITGDMPLNRLWFYPVPGDSTAQLVLYTWGKTEAFTSLTDSVVFPDGYEEFFTTNLAVALCSSFQRPVHPVLAQRATAARNAVESMNLDPLYMSIDGGLLRGIGYSKAIRSNGLSID